MRLSHLGQTVAVMGGGKSIHEALDHLCVDQISHVQRVNAGEIVQVINVLPVIGATLLISLRESLPVDILFVFDELRPGFILPGGQQFSYL